MSSIPYVLGIDLGTTYTAAATSRGDRAEIVPLASASAVIPSVVVLREDGDVLTGEAAERRSVSEPGRTAREFKRRLGDPTPILVGGTPYGAEALAAHLLRAVMTEVVAREGSRPTRVVLTHPASWGMFKLDLFRQAARMAELGDVEFVTEPEAAAVHYSNLERIEVGEVIAVYDLGGGTFDAALLRRTPTGFQLLGTPEGMERFGGIDIDRAVLAHVDRSVDGLLQEQSDSSDPSVRVALARLRDDARSAKEALSSDTDATIPVMLPSLATEVRITRAELESIVRPRLVETIDTVERTLRSAGLAWPDIARVVTVGGSSRMPIVREMLRERSGRPVSDDAHPKHAIALGAAEIGGAQRAALVGPVPPALPAAILSVPIPASAQSLPAPAPSPPATSGRFGRHRNMVVVGVGLMVLAIVAVVVVTKSGNDKNVAAPIDRSVDGTDATNPVTNVVLPTAVPPTAVPLPAAPITSPPLTLPVTAAPTSSATVLPTAAPTVPPTAAPTLPPAGVTVVDASGSFAVDVPVGFTTNITPLTVGSVTVARVSASPNLDRYLVGDWTVDGFSTIVADRTQVGTPAQLVALFDPGIVCGTSSGVLPYTAPQGTGVIVRYDQCSGDFAEILISVDVPSLGAIVFFGIQGLGPSDGLLLSAAEATLQTVRAP